MNQVIKVTKNNERRIDELGRFVIPLTTRKKFQIHKNDYIEICESGKNITLRKVKRYSKSINNFKMILDNTIEINIDVKQINNDISKSINCKGTIGTVDELGRIIIPYQLRKKLNIREKETLKICEKENMIILIKKEYDDNNKRKFHSGNN